MSSTKSILKVVDKGPPPNKVEEKKFDGYYVEPLTLTDKIKSAEDIS